MTVAGPNPSTKTARIPSRKQHCCNRTNGERMAASNLTSDPDLDQLVTGLLTSDTAALADPYPIYRQLRAVEGLYLHPSGPTVVVSRFSDVRAVLGNSEEMSNRGLAVGSRAEAIRSKLEPADQQIFDEVAAFENLYVSRADGDLHQRVRRISQRAFSPRKMSQLEGQAQQYTEQLLDEMIQSGEDDWVRGFSSRLPMMMICSLLDVPLSDIDLIRGWTASIGKNRGGAVLEDLRAAHAALNEFREYVRELVAVHREEKEHSELVSSLMGAAASGELTEDELLATMVVLLFGGSDTTSALLANGLAALLTEPGRWDELVGHVQDGNSRVAIEELIRYVTPVQTLWRVSTDDVEHAGETVPEGTTFLLVLGAANRDPSVFDEPDALQLDRTPNHHIGFGHGIHFCVGAALARLEGVTVLQHLAREAPQLSLTKQPEVADWTGNIQFRTLSSLKVSLGR